MDTGYCFSCGMPLDAGASPDVSSNYCGYCTASDGTLKPREEVTNGIAQWMKMWQPDVGDAKALARAKAYMNGMPAWAAD